MKYEVCEVYGCIVCTAQMYVEVLSCIYCIYCILVFPVRDSGNEVTSQPAEGAQLDWNVAVGKLGQIRADSGTTDWGKAGTNLVDIAICSSKSGTRRRLGGD